MFRSWKIGTVAGIDLRIHSTLLLMLLWMGMSGVSLTGHPVLSTALNLVLPGMLFFVIALHELGHALAARRYGVATRDITLYPFGGVAHLAGMPSRPRQEMAVAAAGPAVNVVLAAAAWLLGGVVTNPLAAYLLDNFLWINVGLAVFNLLPAFPMDGGRILRAYLTLRSDAVTATRKAADLGRKLAWAMGLIGLFTWQWNLIFIGIFVWIAATAEQGQAMFNRIRYAAPRARTFDYTNRRRGFDESQVIEGEYRVVG